MRRAAIRCKSGIGRNDDDEAEQNVAFESRSMSFLKSSFTRRDRLNVVDYEVLGLQVAVATIFGFSYCLHVLRLRVMQAS